MKKLKGLCAALPLVVAAAVLPACSAEEYAAATFTADEAVTAVSVDVADRKVVFAESADGSVCVDYYYNGKENYSIAVDGGVLSITQANTKNWYDFFGTGGERSQRLITVYLPSDCLESVYVSTTNFDIILSQTTVSGNCTLYSNGGSVNMEKLSADSVSLSAKNGSVTGSIVGAYEDYILDISIKKGDSNLSSKSTGEKLLKVDVNNGDINLQFVKA
ncbi:MAG: DUF4097 domain-containing protein [Clostridia bacterium]|nr:DUF4097 domain-containing protein [Clostridia bacterium]